MCLSSGLIKSRLSNDVTSNTTSHRSEIDAFSVYFTVIYLGDRLVIAKVSVPKVCSYSLKKKLIMRSVGLFKHGAISTVGIRLN